MNEREELKKILLQRSVLKGEFTLVSGKKSSYYINGKMTTLHSRGLYLVAKLLLEMIEQKDYDAFGGPTIGADPIIGALLTLTSQRGIAKEGLLIRKESKDHGTESLVEGNISPGMKVAILEDVATTGGSILKAAKEIEKNGCTVTGLYTIVDRQEGAKENIAREGYQFQSLFKIGELL